MPPSTSLQAMQSSGTEQRLPKEIRSKLLRFEGNIVADDDDNRSDRRSDGTSRQTVNRAREYSYSTLPTDRKRIRLLRLLPGVLDSPQIDCELFEAEFDEKGVLRRLPPGEAASAATDVPRTSTAPKFYENSPYGDDADYRWRWRNSFVKHGREDITKEQLLEDLEELKRGKSRKWLREKKEARIKAHEARKAAERLAKKAGDRASQAQDSTKDDVKAVQQPDQGRQPLLRAPQMQHGRRRGSSRSVSDTSTVSTPPDPSRADGSAFSGAPDLGINSGDAAHTAEHETFEEAPETTGEHSEVNATAIGKAQGEATSSNADGRKKPLPPPESEHGRDQDSKVEDKRPEKKVQKQQRVKYEAMSWRWGNEVKGEYAIMIRENEKQYKMRVSETLGLALKYLRSEGDRILWIDAICINQKDFQERSAQVAMMSLVYSGASGVCVWIGDDDDDSARAIRFIKSHIGTLKNFDKLCTDKTHSEDWKALLALMQRDWFSRRWVVQEIALAKEATVYCGPDDIQWRDLAIAVELFVEVETATHRLSELMRKDEKYGLILNWFEHISELGASLLVGATGRIFRGYDASPLNAKGQMMQPPFDINSLQQRFRNRRALEELQKRKKTRRNDETSGRSLLGLEYLVTSLSIFDCGRPHDSVYALVAIARDASPFPPTSLSEVTKNSLVGEIFTKELEQKPYPLDYRKPYPEVCKEFVQFCITNCKRSDPIQALDILCRPWAKDWRSTDWQPFKADTERTIKEFTYVKADLNRYFEVIDPNRWHWITKPLTDSLPSQDPAKQVEREIREDAQTLRPMTPRLGWNRAQTLYGRVLRPERDSEAQRRFDETFRNRLHQLVRTEESLRGLDCALEALAHSINHQLTVPRIVEVGELRQIYEDHVRPNAMQASATSMASPHSFFSIDELGTVLYHWGQQRHWDENSPGKLLQLGYLLCDEEPCLVPLPDEVHLAPGENSHITIWIRSDCVAAGRARPDHSWARFWGICSLAKRDWAVQLKMPRAKPWQYRDHRVNSEWLLDAQAEWDAAKEENSHGWKKWGVPIQKWFPKGGRETTDKSGPRSLKTKASTMDKGAQKLPTKTAPENKNKDSKRGVSSSNEARKGFTKPFDLELPSWVARITDAPFDIFSHPGMQVDMSKMGRKNADPLVGLPRERHRNYSAAQSRGVDPDMVKFRKRPRLCHYSLYVTGFRFDKVKKVAQVSQSGAIPVSWLELAGWGAAARPGAAGPDADPLGPPDQFWRTLVADRGMHDRNPPYYYSRACKETILRGGIKSNAVDTTALIYNERNSIIAEFCRRVQAVIWNRALIMTEKGALGLAPPGVKPGDVVCIIYGCTVPVILRRCPKPKGPKVRKMERWEDRLEAMEAVLARCAKGRIRKARFQNSSKEWKEEIKLRTQIFNHKKPTARYELFRTPEPDDEDESWDGIKKKKKRYWKPTVEEEKDEDDKVELESYDKIKAELAYDTDDEEQQAAGRSAPGIHVDNDCPVNDPTKDPPNEDDDFVSYEDWWNGGGSEGESGHTNGTDDTTDEDTDDEDEEMQKERQNRQAKADRVDPYWHYEFIGQSYINGRMNGEAVRQKFYKNKPDHVFELR